MASAVDELIEAAAAVPSGPAAPRRKALARVREAARKVATNGPLSPEQLAAAIARTPLVGVTAASAILGVATPNFKRYRDRLTPIPVEGSADVFVRAEVEALADELKAAA